MKLQINIAGIGSVSVEGDTSKQVIAEAAFWSGLPSECPICKAPVKFFFRTPQEFLYYGMYCTGRVTHDCNFGQKKKDGSLFYRGPSSWRDSIGFNPEEDEHPTPQVAPPQDRAVEPPVRHAQSANRQEAAPAPHRPQAEQRDPKGAKTVFFGAYNWFGVGYGDMGQEDRKKWFTTLNSGITPESWTAETYERLSDGAVRYLAAMQRLNPDYLEKMVPYAVVLDYYTRVFPNRKPKRDVLELSAADWKALADAMETWEKQSNAAAPEADLQPA